MTPWEAVIWDVDGTLIESEGLHAQSVIEVVERSTALDLDDVNALVGVPLADVYDRVAGGTDFISWPTFRARVCAVYLKNLDSSLARPGARELVESLHARGVPQACASSAERVVLEANLCVLGLQDILETSISCEDVAKTKPAPDAYALACWKLGVPPSACLAVEDSEAGVASALAAGLPVVAWPHEMTRDHDLSAATWVVDSLYEAPPFKSARVCTSGG